MTSEEALAWLDNVPKDHRTPVQERVFLFLDTIRQNPAAWEKAKRLELPENVARDVKTA